MEDNTFASSFQLFAREVKHKNMGLREITKAFHQKVDKGDYNEEDEDTLIEYLFKVSNTP